MIVPVVTYPLQLGTVSVYSSSRAIACSTNTVQCMYILYLHVCTVIVTCKCCIHVHSSVITYHRVRAVLCMFSMSRPHAGSVQLKTEKNSKLYELKMYFQIELVNASNILHSILMQGQNMHLTCQFPRPQLRGTLSGRGYPHLSRHLRARDRAQTAPLPYGRPFQITGIVNECDYIRV